MFRLWMKTGLVAAAMVACLATSLTAQGIAPVGVKPVDVKPVDVKQTNDLWAVPAIPGLEVARTPEQVSGTVRLLILLTVLTLAPSILIMTTCFTRIVIVLSLLRNALATQLPPNQIIVGLSLFLTFMIMAPTWQQVNEQALAPLMAGKMTAPEAYEKGIVPVRQFMFQQVRRADLAMFMEVAKVDANTQLRDIPTTVVIPAFIISELKTAFIMGFVLYLPFLIIDMVTASVLISMGMMMLPPVLISLPFKLLLFVLADGWNLVVKSLVESFM